MARKSLRRDDILASRNKRLDTALQNVLKVALKRQLENDKLELKAKEKAIAEQKKVEEAIVKNQLKARSNYESDLLLKIGKTATQSANFENSLQFHQASNKIQALAAELNDPYNKQIAKHEIDLLSAHAATFVTNKNYESELAKLENSLNNVLDKESTEGITAIQANISEFVKNFGPTANEANVKKRDALIERTNDIADLFSSINRYDKDPKKAGFQLDPELRSLFNKGASATTAQSMKNTTAKIKSYEEDKYAKVWKEEGDVVKRTLQTTNAALADQDFFDDDKQFKFITEGSDQLTPQLLTNITNEVSDKLRSHLMDIDIKKPFTGPFGSDINYGKDGRLYKSFTQNGINGVLSEVQDAIKIVKQDEEFKDASQYRLVQEALVRINPEQGPIGSGDDGEFSKKNLIITARLIDALLTINESRNKISDSLRKPGQLGFPESMTGSN